MAFSCSNTECTGLWCERCALSVSTCPKCDCASAPVKNAHVIKLLRNKIVFCLHRAEKHPPAIVKSDLDRLRIRGPPQEQHDSKRVKVGGSVSFDDFDMNPSPLRTNEEGLVVSFGTDRPDVFMMEEASTPAPAPAAVDYFDQQPSSEMEESYRSPAMGAGVSEVKALMDQCGEDEDEENNEMLGKRKTEEVEEEGCFWMGQLSELSQHLATTCAFELVRCGHHDCHDHIQRRDLEAHGAQCPLRPTTCTHCAHMVPFRAMSEHEVSCPQSPYVCMCGAKMLLQEKPAHADECPLSVVTCEFSEHGCTETVTREGYEAHLRESCGKHSLLVATALKQMKTKQDEIKDEMTKNKAELRRDLTQVSSAAQTIGSTIVMKFRVEKVSEKIKEAGPHKSEVFFVSVNGTSQCPHALRFSVTFLEGSKCRVGLELWKETSSKYLKSNQDQLDLTGTSIGVLRNKITGVGFPDRDWKKTIKNGVIQEGEHCGFNPDSGLKDLAAYIIEDSLAILVTFKVSREILF